MNTQETILKINELIEKATMPIDKNRICDYCNLFYFATRTDQKCCSKRCSDNHYNEKIRPIRQAKKLMDQLIAEEKKFSDYKNSISSPENVIKNNIRIFKKLTIDPEVGTIYFILDILDLGVSFQYFSFKKRIGNKIEKCYSLHYNEYKVTRLDSDRLKIEKTKNI